MQQDTVFICKLSFMCGGARYGQIWFPNLLCHAHISENVHFRTPWGPETVELKGGLGLPPAMYTKGGWEKERGEERMDGRSEEPGRDREGCMLPVALDEHGL